MSFLNSVLSSIGGDGSQPSTPPIPSTRPQGTNPASVMSRARDGTSSGATPNNKRKAEEELQGSNGKIMKSAVVDRQKPHAPPPAGSQSKAASNLANIDKPSTPNVAMPSRGISKPTPVGTSSVNVPQASTTPAIDSTKAPKKGSYAEIMARAKASQSKPPAVGVISHKPKDKMAISYKKEMKLKKKALKNKKLGIKDDSRPGSSGSVSSSPAPVPSEKKKPPQPAYKGTAKSKPQPSYKGTMNPKSPAIQKPTPKDVGGNASRQRYDEYAATDEEDLDDVEEDDYGSEESDDMEAGFSDVELEESAAAKAAKKEDEEEAKLEAKLKNEKEERKKRLEAMAKKAKPQRY